MVGVRGGEREGDKFARGRGGGIEQGYGVRGASTGRRHEGRRRRKEWRVDSKTG